MTWIDFNEWFPCKEAPPAPPTTRPGLERKAVEKWMMFGIGYSWNAARERGRWLAGERRSWGFVSLRFVSVRFAGVEEDSLRAAEIRAKNNLGSPRVIGDVSRYSSWNKCFT